MKAEGLGGKMLILRRIGGERECDFTNNFINSKQKTLGKLSLCSIINACLKRQSQDLEGEGAGEVIPTQENAQERYVAEWGGGRRECVMWVLVAEGSVSVSNNNYLLLQLCIHPRSCTFGHYHTWDVQRLPA